MEHSAWICGYLLCIAVIIICIAVIIILLKNKLKKCDNLHIHKKHTISNNNCYEVSWVVLGLHLEMTEEHRLLGQSTAKDLVC